ncbi:very short patch repair endonuclease [Roseomonas sp. HF4]|uniref:very short patch repair endonuclease n=1 Tax=Roseomonas sp. HF4 TaxID=2562313 RepID=UPI003514B264
MAKTITVLRGGAGLRATTQISSLRACHAMSDQGETRTARSGLMSRIGSKDTKPEVVVRKGLHARGERFRLHRKDLPGKPDVVLPRHRTAVFVHGCFWHGCPDCDRGQRRPKSNTAFWNAKLAANQTRDARDVADLQNLGWRVETIWECATRDPSRLNIILDRLVRSWDSPSHE